MSLLLLSAILLLVGIFAPMMTLSRFVWIENSFSLFAGTIQLYKDGQYLLFIILSYYYLLLSLFCCSDSGMLNPAATSNYNTL